MEDDYFLIFFYYIYIKLLLESIIFMIRVPSFSLWSVTPPVVPSRRAKPGGKGWGERMRNGALRYAEPGRTLLTSSFTSSCLTPVLMSLAHSFATLIPYPLRVWGWAPFPSHPSPFLLHPTSLLSLHSFMPWGLEEEWRQDERHEWSEREPSGRPFGASLVSHVPTVVRLSLRACGTPEGTEEEWRRNRPRARRAGRRGRRDEWMSRSA